MRASPDPRDDYTVEHRPPFKNGKAPRRKLGAHTAAELLDMELPPISYIVPDYICEGLTLLAGKSKIGKSWLLASMAIAVATGGLAFGTIPVEEGDVLLLALSRCAQAGQRMRAVIPLFDLT
jgi:RecA-family ATPase